MLNTTGEASKGSEECNREKVSFQRILKSLYIELVEMDVKDAGDSEECKDHGEESMKILREIPKLP